MAKTLQELNLEDDFLFAKVMTDQDICRKVLESILGIEIEKIEFLISQNTIQNLMESKGVRLDVYVRGSGGTVYCCEMQNGRKKELPKRTRYYQGSIDLDMITKGGNYKNLKQSFIIFICTSDPFDRKRHYYTFRETCVEDPSLLLGDETTKIFLNTKGKIGKVDEELKEFLGYIDNSTEAYVKKAKSGLIKSIHQKVRYIKESKEMEAEYMTLLLREQDIREEAMEAGRAEGREAGRQEGRETTLDIINLHLSGYPVSEISDELQINEDVIVKVISSLKPSLKQDRTKKRN